MPIFEQLQHAFVEHLVDRDNALGKTLRVVRDEERIKHVLVFVDAVGPEVLTHQNPVFLQPFIDEWHGDLARRHFFEMLNCELFRFRERLEDRFREPPVTFCQLRAHREYA